MVPVWAEIRDEELIRQISEKGSREAGEALWQRHSERVSVYCRLRLRDAATAEDATSETFLRVFRYAASFDRGVSRPNGAALAWIFGIARNCCNDVNQRRREAPLTGAALAMASAAPAVDPFVRGRLLLGLQAICPAQAACLRLYAEGFSYSEIASRTDSSPGAVKSRIQNGVRMLRGWLVASAGSVSTGRSDLPARRPKWQAREWHRLLP